MVVMWLGIRFATTYIAYKPIMYSTKIDVGYVVSKMCRPRLWTIRRVIHYCTWDMQYAKDVVVEGTLQRPSLLV